MISVVIPTYNNVGLLKTHVEMYRDQSLAQDKFEVIVVNDGGDGVEEIEGLLPNLVCVTLAKNSGPAHARNVGAENARYERVLFVGDDCFPTQDLLLIHALHHQRYPHVALQGFSPFHPSVMDTTFMHWLDRSGMQASWQSLQKDGNWIKEADGFLLTTNWSIDRDDFLAFDGFPEDFPTAAWEDVCLGHKLRRSGYKTVFNPEAVNYHYHKHTIESFVRRSIREGRSRVTLAYLYPEFASTLLSPSNLRGALEAPIEEIVEQAKILQYIPQANIDDNLRTAMMGFALRGAWEEMQYRGGVFLALPHVKNSEFPAYIFSCAKAIAEGNNGFVQHCIGWANMKEPSNWATFGFIGEAWLAIGNEQQAYLNFAKAVEMTDNQDAWVVRRLARMEK
jgi:GT2 family glycosyltransferase